ARLIYEVGNDLVERASTLEGVALDLGVAAKAKQQRDEGQLVGENAHGGAQHIHEFVDRGASRGQWVDEDCLEAVESTVESKLEQVLLARHVVVNRRLCDAEVFSQNAHRSRVVAVLDEDLCSRMQD